MQPLKKLILKTILLIILHSKIEAKSKIAILNKVLNQAKELDFSGCNLKLEAIILLAKALEKNDTILSLDLCGCKITTQGAKALAKALEKNNRLTQLNLEYNVITPEGIQALASALKTNQGLTDLNLRTNTMRDSVEIAAIVEALKTNKKLTKLNLGGRCISSITMQALVEALKINHTLKNLVLANSAITLEGIKALAWVLGTNQSSITELDLSNSFIIGGNKGILALVSALETNKSLTMLHLGWLHGTSKIGATGSRALAQALMLNQTLKKLNIQDNAIGSEGALALAEALKTNQTVNHLNLSHNEIRLKGIQGLANSLITNQTLTSLNLDCNFVGFEASTKAFAKVFKINQNLMELSFKTVCDSPNNPVKNIRINNYLKRNKGLPSKKTKKVEKILESYLASDLIKLIQDYSDLPIENKKSSKWDLFLQRLVDKFKRFLKKIYPFFKNIKNKDDTVKSNLKHPPYPPALYAQVPADSIATGTAQSPSPTDKVPKLTDCKCQPKI